ncbi:FAD-dependent monooxygenase [Actinopolyspora mortivallis]|uniref:FAD-binding domain-containing protein n=1 Tax=Actinopolyspora mortivallis TaxID=33906 RepID=A0A2T0GT24_ACTMO|nr:FAD-dependent monooxygenase [Actinopolyspora mortivallis]PRW62265.1 hypothetical protein CEP50_16480 [Actinopolyspora mortivallis]
MTEPDVDVLIAGGGPVGLLLANELRKRGVPVVVAEATETIRQEPRAGTLHARTVQSLTRSGYLNAPDGNSSGKHSVPFHFAGLSGLTIHSPASEGNPLLNLPQEELERDLERSARQRGTDLRRGHRVTGIRPHDTAVEVTVESPRGEYSVRASYVVGADGARSTVREQAAVTNDTRSPTFGAVLGMVRLTEPDKVPGGWSQGPTGWTLINPNPTGHSRVIAHEFTRPLPDHRSPLDLTELRTRTSRILGFEVGMSDPDFLTRFSDFCRLADSFRTGRVLLAGDAAHVHSPLGGQGVNLGLQDALNLGWKLSLVVSGSAGEDLLDGYHAERWAAARRVVDNTRAQAALMRPGEEVDRLRELFGELLELDEANELVQRRISGQAVTYEPLDPTDTLHEGRFQPNLGLTGPDGRTSVVELLTPGNGVLLLGQHACPALEDAARAWKDRVEVHRVDPDEPQRWNAALLRPDGYLAWTDAAGDVSATGLERHLTHYFGPAATAH